MPQPVQDEIREPPLAPVPVRLATPLERQFAEALGIGNSDYVPRLPADCAGCEMGSMCCWRWLARAAMVQVNGTGPALAQCPLAEMVTRLSLELESLRADSLRADEESARANRAEEQAATVQRATAAIEQEVKELRQVERDLGRLQAEAAELRASNGRLRGKETQLVEDAKRLELEKKKLVEVDVATAEKKVQQMEKDLSLVKLEKEQLEFRLQASEEEAKAQRTQAARCKKTLEDEIKLLKRRLRKKERLAKYY